MTFSETYRAERLIDRRSRGRKARIAGRIIGFGLVACLLVAIRTDPELRAMVDDAALAAISGAMPEKHNAETEEHAAALAELGLEAQVSNAGAVMPVGVEGKPAVRHMPASKVKIHRGGIVKD